MRTIIATIILAWLILVMNVHCQCIDTVGHVALECKAQFNNFYETYPDSLFKIQSSWWQCTCMKCYKTFTIRYKSERIEIWRRK